MKRLRAIVGAGSCEELARRLVWLSCVDLDVSPEPPGAVLAPVDTAERRRGIENRISQATDAIDLLSSRSAAKAVKKKLFSPKPELERGDDPERTDEAKQVTDRASELRGRMEELRAERARVVGEVESILPWREYDVPVSVSGTETTDIIIGSVPPGSVSELAGIPDSYNAEIIFENDSDGVRYISVIVHKSDTAALLRFLTSVGFVRSPAAALDGTADSLLAERKDALHAIDDEDERLSAEADELSASLPLAEYYSDTERTSLSYTDAVSRMTATESTRYLSGWIPADAEAEVTAELEAIGCAYEITDPDDGEDVPVKLKNNKFAESFEPVVELYSLPKYGTYDPTFVMSIFYMILFGLMFADFGYGLIVSAVCVLGLVLMKPRGTLRKFLRMFAICGISSMFFGVLLGGYFGDLPSKMSANFFGGSEFSLAIWFDPINDPMTFLIVSLAVGALHLVGALCVKFYVLCKTKTLLDAIFDAGSWILVFLGGGCAAVGVAAFPPLTTVGIVLVVIGYAILIATQGRAEKNIFLRIGKGLKSLYDTISYVSDLLSYSRVLSLGLASAVIGSVFNLLGTLAGPNFFGLILFVIAVLLGHTLNIAINLLGTFVHTSRLQYIEFFGKFYESGGRAFVPLEPKPKYYVYKEKVKTA